jgi:hypothetical protein
MGPSFVLGEERVHRVPFLDPGPLRKNMTWNLGFVGLYTDSRILLFIEVTLVATSYLLDTDKFQGWDSDT